MSHPNFTRKGCNCEQYIVQYLVLEDAWHWVHVDALCNDVEAEEVPIDPHTTHGLKLVLALVPAITGAVEGAN